MDITIPENILHNPEVKGEKAKMLLAYLKHIGFNKDYVTEVVALNLGWKQTAVLSTLANLAASGHLDYYFNSQEGIFKILPEII